MNRVDQDYEEVKRQAVAILKKLDPTEPYGTELFEALSLLTIGVPIEAVIVREGANGTEVFLTQRKAGEAYEGQWHCPGTFMRPGEEIDDVFARLALREDLGELRKKIFVGCNNNTKEARGHVIHLVYEVEASPDLEVGKWFLVSELPENIVENHRDVLIPAVVNHRL